MVLIFTEDRYTKNQSQHIEHGRHLRVLIWIRRDQILPSEAFQLLYPHLPAYSLYHLPFCRTLSTPGWSAWSLSSRTRQHSPTHHSALCSLSTTPWAPYSTFAKHIYLHITCKRVLPLGWCHLASLRGHQCQCHHLYTFLTGPGRRSPRIKMRWKVRVPKWGRLRVLMPSYFDPFWI